MQVKTRIIFLHGQPQKPDQRRVKTPKHNDRPKENKICFLVINTLQKLPRNDRKTSTTMIDKKSKNDLPQKQNKVNDYLIAID